MKKILLGMCIFLITASFTCKPTKTPLAANIKQLTLDNVEAKKADIVIHDFINRMDIDKTPTQTSVWFSKEMIHDIVQLLHREIKVELANQDQNTTDKKPGITDGIRIYFVSDTNSKSYPLKTSILLVSTKDNGPSSKPIQSCLSRRKHIDYYDHELTDSLFSLDFYGLKYSGKDFIGDSLNLTCTNCKDDANCPSIPHAIKRKDAENMVHNFNTHNLNTIGEWFDLSFWETIDADKRHTGIRIYFATNPLINDNTYTSLRDVFVITTTEFDPQNGINKDYFDCKLNSTIEENYQKKYQLPTMGPEDKGELCPENCSPGDSLNFSGPKVEPKRILKKQLSKK